MSELFDLLGAYCIYMTKPATGHDKFKAHLTKYFSDASAEDIEAYLKKFQFAYATVTPEQRERLISGAPGPVITINFDEAA